MLRGTLDHKKASHHSSKGGTTRMLAAYLDAGAQMVMQGDQQKIDADLRGLRVETQTNVSRRSSSRVRFGLANLQNCSCKQTLKRGTTHLKAP